MWLTQLIPTIFVLGVLSRQHPMVWKNWRIGCKTCINWMYQPFSKVNLYQQPGTKNNTKNTTPFRLVVYKVVLPSVLNGDIAPIHGLRKWLTEAITPRSGVITLYQYLHIIETHIVEVARCLFLHTFDRHLKLPEKPISLAGSVLARDCHHAIRFPYARWQCAGQPVSNSDRNLVVLDH